MRTQNVSVVSIHPDPARSLALDLKDILACLGQHLDTWVWCVRDLDWLGPDAEATCRQVEAAGPAGLWLSSEELLSRARTVYQTIEGAFLAFPHGSAPEAAELSLRSFPWSRAEFAIVAVDGSCFDVFAKDPDVLAAVRQFADVRDEDPSFYF